MCMYSLKGLKKGLGLSLNIHLDNQFGQGKYRKTKPTEIKKWANLKDEGRLMKVSKFMGF